MAGFTERCRPTRLANTSKVSIFTAPTSKSGSVVRGLLFANETATARRVDIYFDNGTSEWLVWTEEIGVNASSSIFFGADAIDGISLKSGDTFKAQCATAGAITVTPVVRKLQATSAK